MAIDYQALFGAESYDPCAALKALRPIYMQLVVGGGEQRIQFRDRDTWFHKGDLDGLAALIRQLEADCPAAKAAGRRFAITAGMKR